INSRLPIVATPGVKRILGFGRTPAAVNESEVNAIQHIMEAQANAEPYPYLSAGDMVEIESGALQGLTGIIVRVKGADRIVVSVSLLMRSVAVEIDQNSVRPVRAGLPLVGAHQNTALRGSPAYNETFHPERQQPSLVRIER